MVLKQLFLVALCVVVVIGGDRECDEKRCGEKPDLPRECKGNATAAFTGKCLLSEPRKCFWEILDCGCSDLQCERSCPNGYELDERGCETCRCEKACDFTCPPLSCEANEITITPPGQCCPKCVAPCDMVKCQDVTCPTGSTLRKVPGLCCPRCIRDFNCTTIIGTEFCKPKDTRCPAGTQKVRHPECNCFSCKPIPSCDSVVCRDEVCPPGFKKIVDDGSCCPRCAPIPDCSNVICNGTKCENDEEEEFEDLTCCRRCRPRDKCDFVTCTALPCPQESWIKRRGECCFSCPKCEDYKTPMPSDEDNINNKTVCDTNDDTKCPAGIYRGINCSIPVPPEDREQRIFKVVICRAACNFTEQELRLFVSRLTNVSAEYFTVVIISRQQRGERCCTTFEIRITKETTDTTVGDVEEVAAATAEQLAAIGYEVDFPTNVSSAWKQGVSFILLAIAFALVF